MKKFLAVIPARSGSKGIKDKNIRNFCGKPLIYYTIKEAKKSKFLDRIIVSTDSEKYAAIAKKYGAEVPYLRPKNLAGDKSPIIETIIDLLKQLKERENYQPDYVVLLQTTSPLRTYKDIDECVKIALTKKCDGVMTMCRTEQLLYAIAEDGCLKLLFNKDWIKSTNRQTLPATYRINGPMIVLASRKSILRNKLFLAGKIAPVIMENWRSLDLDAEEDFKLAEIIYKNKNRFSQEQFSYY